MEIRYPNIRVTLSDQDRNVFSVLGHVKYALKLDGVSQQDIEAFVDEATKGDYDHLLRTAMRWVDLHD
jgi:hypothetical protein